MQENANKSRIYGRPKVRGEHRKLKEVGFPKQALDRVVSVIRKFLMNNPGKHAPGEQARKILKHLRNAYRHKDNHPDSTVRRSARKLLKAASHANSFEALEDSVRDFAGLVQKTGRKREEKARIQAAEQRQADAYGRLEQVRSVTQLRSAGKQLALCVSGAKWARCYLNGVDDGETELWLYHRGDAPYALVEIDTGDRSITECQTHGGKTPKFSAREARAILATLNSNGDDQDAFARVGVYSVFHGDPPPKTPKHDLGDKRRLRIWSYPDQIIIAVRTGKKRAAWARFQKRDGCWAGGSQRSLRLGELLELARTRPDVRECLGFVE